MNEIELSFLSKKKVLVVEDDDSLRELLKAEIEENNYLVDEAPNYKTAYKKLSIKKYDVIILDLSLPDGNGLDLFNSHTDCLNNKTIIITGNATIENAVEAIKKGAFNYIEKPFDESILSFQIKKIIEFNSINNEYKLLKNEITSNYTFEDIIFESKKMEEVIYRAKILAKTNNIILIEGETGVGKEILSHSIHNLSNRSREIFLPINCAAIPSELVESELFGFDKGAFTGATESYAGKFIQADKGTLFLDEIGDLSLHIQAKLLRVIDDNMIYMLKSKKPKNIDIRIITATNKDLEKEVSFKTFRKDLLYRLQESIIYIPPLRDRREDIMPLFYYFLKTFNILYKKNITKVTKKVEQYLINHNWDGNVREIKNLLKTIIPFKNDDCIRINDIVFLINRQVEQKSKPLSLADYDKKYIKKIYNQTGFNKKKTSELLGISIPTLYKYLNS